MDRFEAMRTLVAAVDGGSLSAAARSLNLPLATVSRRVADLEAHLGAQLLVRGARGLNVTETGAAFVAAARRVIDDLADAERAATGEYRVPRGELIVTAPIMFGKLHVAPIVRSFLAAYPDVTVRLVLADQLVDMAEAHVDVALRIGKLPDSELVARRLGAVRWVTIGAPDYLAARGRPDTPDAVAGHDCIAFEGLQTLRHWAFGEGAARRQVPIRPRLSVNTADAVVAAAEAGVGLARVMCYQAADAIAERRVEVVLKSFEPTPNPVQLVHRPAAAQPLKLRAFLDYATPRLKAVLDWVDRVTR